MSDTERSTPKASSFWKVCLSMLMEPSGSSSLIQAAAGLRSLGLGRSTFGIISGRAPETVDQGPGLLGDLQVVEAERPPGLDDPGLGHLAEVVVVVGQAVAL